MHLQRFLIDLGVVPTVLVTWPSQFFIIQVRLRRRHAVNMGHCSVSRQKLAQLNCLAMPSPSNKLELHCGALLLDLHHHLQLQLHLHLLRLISTPAHRGQPCPDIARSVSTSDPNYLHITFATIISRAGRAFLDSHSRVPGVLGTWARNFF